MNNSESLNNGNLHHYICLVNVQYYWRLIEGVGVTLLLPLVDSVDVRQDVGAARASIFTVRTLVRPLPGVRPEVAVQVVLQSKSFAAEEAGVARSGARH